MSGKRLTGIVFLSSLGFLFLIFSRNFIFLRTQTADNTIIKPQSFTSTRIGHVKKFDQKDGKDYLGFDEVKLFSRKEGTCFLTENEKDEKNETPKCDLNGFYVVDKDTSTLLYEITNKTIIKSTKGIIWFEVFKNLDDEYFKKTLYTLNETGGKINQISEYPL
ncbi:MAG: hypothetical protein Q8Q24_01515 [bacterium]|nr:hypothetical protein [bacterium]